ncbi:Restriction endonuclease [Bacillus sp. THAF10]|uniref:restriction endonuclease n=1 Tax=Bacillus sp. THAF10 TaxID=2587848 RepID=UPI0012A9A22F|nr:restriction endonuclease [Bacillus sp. THAF10]QFT88081.1 Restriction endonuclease [Bacillus sp. THAF10]
MKGLAYFMIVVSIGALVIISQEYPPYITGIGTVVILYLTYNLRLTDKLSKSDIITNYVKSLPNGNYNNVLRSDVKKLQKELQLYYRKSYSFLVVHQAISFSIADKFKVNTIHNSPKNDLSIDSMSGQDFELLLKRHFEGEGFKVTLTPLSGDQGVDLILQKDWRRIAVQCKRYSMKNRVGNSAIQEVATGKLYYDCTECWVITTSYFTSHARNLADKVGVRLIDRDILFKMVNNRKQII